MVPIITTLIYSAVFFFFIHTAWFSILHLLVHLVSTSASEVYTIISFISIIKKMKWREHKQLGSDHISNQNAA